MEKPKIVSKNKMGSLPKTTGVYLFYGANTNARPSSILTKVGRLLNSMPVYVGKAINIKERVKNHFNQPSYRDNLFIGKVEKIGFIKTNSEIEALILEAVLIKKYQPKFNVVWRDDKNYFYVAVVQNTEKVPYIYITHQPNNLKAKSYKLKTNHIGPFVEGNALKKALKYLRRVFPYYTSANHPKNKCAWCHLDLCPGPQPNIEEYRRNINKLVLILRGKRKNALNSLKKEMKAFSNSQEFENAAKTRNQIYALEKIISHAKVIGAPGTIVNSPTRPGLVDNSVSQWQKTAKTLQRILNVKKTIKTIECYDVSNIQGKFATGSMAVFANGKPDKSRYKKFRIKMKNEPNDIAMLKEVLERRFNHPEWKYPEIILIDGGKAQLNIAIKTKNKSTILLKRFKSMVPVKDLRIISIAKGRQELFIENKKRPIPLKNLPQDIYNLIKHLDDEAHRFAIAYHKKLMKKSLRLND